MADAWQTSLKIEVPPISSSEPQRAGGVRLTQTVRAADGKAQADSWAEFEAMALQSLLNASMPKDMGKMFGSGAAGKFWRSTLVEHVSRMIVEGGHLNLFDDAVKSAGNDAAKGTVPRK